MNCIKYCCKEDTPEEAARREELRTECTRDLLYAAVPVFVAASISNFVTSLIEYIAEESENQEAVEISLSVVVAFLLYLYGKYFTLLMAATPSTNSESASCSQSIKIFLEKTRLLGPVLRVASENAGFMIKDFLVQLLMNTVYAERGFGEALGLWLLCVAFCTAAIQASAHLHKAAGCEPEQQARLMHYDCDAFSLGVAYVLTALLAQGSGQAGFRYLSSSSYIYSYENDQDDDGSGADNSYLYTYVLVSTLCVGMVLMTEEYGGIQLRVIKDESAMATAQDVEGMVRNATVEYRHNVYGYFCGLAWFLLIVDNLAHIFGHSTGANLGGALVIASLVAWRGPPYLASMMLRYEQQLRYLKLKRDRAEREGPSNQPRSCGGYLTTLNDWYIQLGASRRMVSIAALKLSLGWVWEVVVSLVFDLLSDAGRGSGLKLVLRMAGMVVVCMVSVAIIKIYEQREAAQSGSGDGDGAEAGGGVEVRNRSSERGEMDESGVTVNPLATSP